MQGLGVKPVRGTFTLVGNAKIDTEKTFSMSNISQSGYKYHRMSLGVDCGDNNVIYPQLMGGFFPNNPMPIIAFSQDYSERFDIPFADRNDSKYAYGSPESRVANNFYKKVGIEKDVNGKLVVKGFLSAYDMIQYLNDNLKDGTRVKVTGEVVYNYYNGEFYVQREINNIFLAREDEKDEEGNVIRTGDKNEAVQDMELYITKDTVSEIDDNVINAYVTQRVSKIDDIKVNSSYIDERTGEKRVMKSRTFPLLRRFDLKIDEDKKALFKKYLTPKDPNKVYKVAVLADIEEKPEIIEVEDVDMGMEDDFASMFQDLYDEEQEKQINSRITNGNVVRRVAIKAVSLRLKQNDNGDGVMKSVLYEEFTDLDTFMKGLMEFNNVIDEVNKSNDEDEFTDKIEDDSFGGIDEAINESVGNPTKSDTIFEDVEIEDDEIPFF